MKETIMQYVNQYLPTVFELVIGFIIAYGMKKITSAFEDKIGKRLNADVLEKRFKNLEGELRSTLDELKDCKSAMVKMEEALTKVKGARK